MDGPPLVKTRPVPGPKKHLKMTNAQPLGWAFVCQASDGEPAQGEPGAFGAHTPIRHWLPAAQSTGVWHGNAHLPAATLQR